MHEHLRERLPEYIRPWAYVVLDKFPVTANGKLDRRALPVPRCQSLTARSFHRIYVAPRTDIANAVRDLEGLASHRSRRRIHDNFFELGGDSVMAARMVARLRQSFVLAVHVRLVFEHPTVERFSAVLQDLAAAAARDAQTPSPAANAEQSDLEAALAAIESISEERLLSGGDSSGSAE